MFLYWIAAERRYVHRKDEVPKGAPVERVDVPTDTAGLMAYLNSLVKIEADPNPAPGEMPLAAVPLGQNCAVVETAEKAVEVLNSGAGAAMVSGEPGFSRPPPRPPMNAIALLSRVDSPGVNVEGVIEAIAKARGYALARYAGAIAIRYQELEKI